MKRLLLSIAVVAALAPRAFAWGEKGHYLVNEAATRGLPNDMPAFFYRAYPQLVWLAYDPDRWRTPLESLTAANEPDHFLDYEFTSGVSLPPTRYAYLAAMEKSGALRRQGITNSEAGFVPWRIAEMTELLTTEMRLWRLSKAGSPERQYLEADIIHDAGILGHFVGDASQPLHATISYNGWILPNPNGYANDCTIHSRFETSFVSRAIEIGDVLPKLAAPQLRDRAFETALSLVKESNGLVEPLYRLDRDGAFAYMGPPSREGIEFASERLAAGASLLRDLWWSAWRNSAQAPKRRTAEE